MADCLIAREATTCAVHPHILLKYLELALRMGETHRAELAICHIKAHLQGFGEHDLCRLIAIVEPYGEHKLVDSCVNRLLARPDLSFKSVRFLLDQLHSKASSDKWESFFVLLRSRLPDHDRTHIDIFRVHKLQGPAAALRLLRASRPSPRSKADATTIGRYLIECAHSHRAVRYLRRCLAAWPADRELLRLFLMALLRSGQTAMAEQVLFQIDRIDTPRLARLWVEAALNRGSDDDALVRLQSVGNGPDRAFALKQMLRIYLRQSDILAAEAILPELNRTLAANDPKRAHFAVRFEGWMLTELRIFRRAMEQLRPEMDRDSAHKLLSPDNFFPAREIIRSGQKPAAAVAHSASGNATELPRRIVQYWDDDPPPVEIGELMESWRSLSGFRYSLYNRKSASSFIKRHLGADKAKLFDMIREPAVQSDFFRLCALYVEGGIYADADNRVVRNPEHFLSLNYGIVAFQDTPYFDEVANDVLITEPGHQIIRSCISMLVDALRSKTSEAAWFRSGPCLITRAVAKAIAESSDGNVSLRLLPVAELLPYVERHATLSYKRTSKHWNFQSPSHATGLLQSMSHYADLLGTEKKCVQPRLIAGCP